MKYVWIIKRLHQIFNISIWFNKSSNTFRSKRKLPHPKSFIIRMGSDKDVLRKLHPTSVWKIPVIFSNEVITADIPNYTNIYSSSFGRRLLWPAGLPWGKLRPNIDRWYSLTQSQSWDAKFSGSFLKLSH